MKVSKDLIVQIQERLERPLPGPEAQYKMAHAIRQKPQTPPDNARIACTLALLYPQEDKWYLPLIQRQSNDPNDRHGGQISFPGGKQEEEDADLATTALREAEEEIGIQAADVHILGQLTQLYIPVSNFLVYPFIGYLDYAPTFTRQESEVQDILKVPMDLLQKSHTVQFTDMKFSNNITVSDIPYYNVHGHVVWGATAMILSEFLEIIDEVLV